MAFHIFRRQAVYYWRRRTPRALAKVLGRQHLSMSLQTTNRAAARRLVTQVNLFLDDVAMFADGTDQLSRSQIETMLHAVVEKQVTKRDAAGTAVHLSSSMRSARVTLGAVRARRPVPPHRDRPMTQVDSILNGCIVRQPTRTVEKRQLTGHPDPRRPWPQHRRPH